MTMMKQIPKISELVDEFWEEQKDNLSYSATSENDKITECALDFMTYKCGALWQDVTDDSNLNNELINLFAQDFVRQFWNNRIAFKNPIIFYIKLRSFLDQWLPVWGQFYKEAILDKSAFITNLGQVSTNQNGLLHVEGLNSGTTSSKGGTTSTTSGTNSATTDGRNTQDTTTNGNTSTSVNGKTTTTGTDTTTKNDSTSTDTQSMNIVADTPQDQINASNFTKTDSKGVGAKPLGAYNFNYASNVNGKHDAVTTKTTGTDSVEHNTTVADNSTTTGKSDTTTNVNGTNHSETTGKNDSTTITQNNNAITNSSNNRSDQNSSSVGNTTTKSRNLPISQIAKEFSDLANGAYLRVFMQAKKAGLFLGVY